MSLSLLINEPVFVTVTHLSIFIELEVTTKRAKSGTFRPL